ncbi:MAG: PD-(D/E)XK nuclease family protein, partial [Clostridia bacterium]|nr:PD-(D/E)XK nuclease family protein [Clostridia bacterium]
EIIDGFTKLIQDFIESPLGMRARAASNVITEKAFLYPIEATRVYPEKEGLIDPGHTIMLQGIIDCMFFEDGNIIIIDYKSDNVEPGNEEEHAKRYQLQLDLYSEATEGLTGLGVSERYIHFLKTGVSVRL